MSQEETSVPISPIHFREATIDDRALLIALINSAFSVETFLEGPRTNQARLTAMMEKGNILLAEDSHGKPLASVYMERRGTRGYLGMLAVDPARQREGLGRRAVGAAEDRFRQQDVALFHHRRQARLVGPRALEKRFDGKRRVDQRNQQRAIINRPPREMNRRNGNRSSSWLIQDVPGLCIPRTRRNTPMGWKSRF